MGKKRLLATIFLPLLLVTFLQSQSLTDLAKKEKERRAALKGKGTTVTTADIAKVKKRPAVEAGGQEEVPAGEQAAQAGQAEVQAPPEGADPAAAQPAGEAAAEEENPAGEKPAMSALDIQKKQQELADLAQQKMEMVDLLTTKMNALYQEFYGLDNLKSREMVQLQISDTFDKLLKAEAESAKAQKDLEDFLKKDQTSAVWIK